MIQPFTVRIPVSRPWRAALIGLMAASMATIVLPAIGAPEYALSGRADQLEKVVLAHTPMGPLSALDLLIYNDIAQGSVGDIPAEVWLHPGSLAAEAFIPRIHEAIDQLVADEAIARRAGSWQPPADHLRVLCHGCAIAAWIRLKVFPEVKIQDADVSRFYLSHPEKYIQRRRAEVRYIFRRVADMTDADAKKQAVDRLEALARRIDAGELTFEEATRQNSDAESAQAGGLLPAFYDGSYFKAFEEQAFAIQEPGRLSPVFEGPSGLYMIQLVQSSPARNVPISEVADDIRQGLQYDHVRHYYQYMLEKANEPIFKRNNAALWDYLAREAPIAQVGLVSLNRQDFLRFYPDPIDPDFHLLSDRIFANTDRWIEGETIMAELEHAKAPYRRDWINRGLELAAIWLKTAHVCAVEVPRSAYATPESGIKTLSADKAFQKRLRACRLVQFELGSIEPKPQPTPEARSSNRLIEPNELQTKKAQLPSEIRATRRLAERIDQQLAAGRLATEPVPIDLADWAGQVRTAPTAADALQSLRRAINATAWPSIKLKVEDMGWVEVIPGSSWDYLVGGIGVGAVGHPQWNPKGTCRYLVVDERPIEIEKLMDRPLLVQSLAYGDEKANIGRNERERVKKSGGITYSY